MLAVASAGVDGYRTTQELLGLQPVHGNRFATLTARLRRHGVLDTVTAAICQLARKLDEHGTPIDYARRRRLRSLSQAKLDPPGWRRSRHLLTRPDTWAHCRHASHAELPAAPIQEHLARLRLIELLTGTHPATYPGRCGCPDATAKTTPSSSSPCPSRSPASWTTGHASCCATPESTNHSAGNRPSAGSPASPGPDPTPATSTPATCTRSCARTSRPRRRRQARHHPRPHPAGRRTPPGAITVTAEGNSSLATSHSARHAPREPRKRDFGQLAESWPTRSGPYSDCREPI